MQKTIMQNNELLSPEGSDKVGREVFKLLEDVLRFKEEQGLPDKWHRCYELSRNRHWRNKAKRGVPLVTANLLFTHRQRTVAMLTDNNPTFNVLPAGDLPEDQQMAVELLPHTCEHWWRETEQQGVLEESVSNGETYGITIEKMRFDPDDEYGLGEVKTELVDPYHFGWYPVKAKPEQALAMLHFWPMNVREARRRWPEHAAKIQADKDWIDKIKDDRLTVTSNVSRTGGYFTTIGSVVKHVMNQLSETNELDEDVLIVEAWVKDFSRTTKGDTEYDLYPGNIRCVHTCNGGDIVLDDVKNPSINWEVLTLDEAAQTYLFSRFPFSVAVSIRDTTNHWGCTDLEQLEGLQIEINKTISQFTLLKDRLSRVKIINPKNSGVANSEFTNAPGIVNPQNHLVADALRYMDPPKIPADLKDALEMYRGLLFTISGAFDMEQNDTSATAYKSIAVILERVATLLRSKLRNYYKLIRDRGRMFVSLAANWYVEERWISYEQEGGAVSLGVKGRDLIIPAKLNVVSGSTMPVSKVQHREEALELGRLGMLDAEAVLEALEFKGRKEIVSRMKQGPIGELIEKLQQLGLPEQAAQFFAELGQMDEKQFKAALKKGELPPLDQVFNPEATPQQPGMAEVADFQVKQAQAEKLRADIQKIMKEIEAKQVEIEVKRAGVEFDREKLAIERARTVNEIKNAERESENRKVELSNETKVAEAKQRSQGPNREKGLKSNNKED